MTTLKELTQQRDKIEAEIESQYWAFTRQARGNPVDGTLYILRNENAELIKEEQARLKTLDTWPYPDIAERYWKKDYTWREVSERIWFDQLECVPPARQKCNAFMVGEEYDYNYQLKSALHTAGVEVDGRYFMRIAPIKQFDPATYTAEIRQQFGL